MNRVFGGCVSLVLAGGLACGSSPKKSKKEPVVLSTSYDDERAGIEAEPSIEAEMGLVQDPELVAYVSRVGRALRRFAPPGFRYRFQIVDQKEPNAFALPGGGIYVSRGLLALASTEDELAGVLGHEITHVYARHAAARQEIASRNPLQMPMVRMGRLAAYGRNQERDADVGGQELARRAGYDPAGLGHFLRKLDSVDRLLRGNSSVPSYFATHPGSKERAASAAGRVQRNEGSSSGRDPGGAVHLSMIDGISLGAKPSEGVFQGSRFLHPELGFQIRFPEGWLLMNSHTAVGA